MVPSPSKLAEITVGLLIPPAVREEVLGDLHERYLGPRQYLLDAIQTIPLVIVSRIYRKADTQLLFMNGFALYLSFLGAAWFLDPTILYDQWGLLRLAIPAALAMLGLVVGDAYARHGRGSPLRPIRAVLIGVGIAFLSQAVLSAFSPEMAVPLWIMLYGSGMSLLLVSALRILFAQVGDRKGLQ